MNKETISQEPHQLAAPQHSETLSQTPNAASRIADANHQTFPSSLPVLFTRDFTFLCLITLSYFSSFFFFFPTLPFFITRLGGQEADIGMLIGLSSLVSCGMKPFAGRWVDHRGRVRLMGLAVSVFTCTAALHAWASSLTLLVGLRILYGIALGCFTTASGAYLADVAPPARRGEAASYWGLVNPAAMGIIPPLALGLMHSSALHPLETHLVTTLPGLSATAAWPENFALLFFTAAGIALTGSFFSLGMHEYHVPQSTGQRAPLFAREALLPMTVNLFLYLTFTSYTSFLPLYARTFGIHNAGYLYTTYALALLSIRLVGARMGDQFGRAAVIIPGLIAVVLGLLILALAPKTYALYLGVTFYGVGFGLAQPGLSAFTIDRLSPTRRGIGMSTFGQGLDLGMGLGGILMGFVATHIGFTAMYACGSGCVVLALLIFLLGTRATSQSVA
ncbi:MAG: MFS transporter [Candidatus Binatia bacterium]